MMELALKTKKDQMDKWDCRDTSRRPVVYSYTYFRKKKEHLWERSSKVKHTHILIEKKIFKRAPIHKKELSIEDRFYELAKNWKKETAMFSLVRDKIVNSDYMAIIGLGRTFKDTILKLILTDLEKKEEFWHYALKTITDNNPVPKGSVNDLRIVRESWLKWGKDQQII